MPVLVNEAFNVFPREAECIGRLLSGYAMLEIDLMHCAMWASDLDTTLKVMYRARGETARVKIADALARKHYHNLKLGVQFERAIGAMRHCLKIRNQYSHCIWWDDNSGMLTFADLEELAELNSEVTDLKGLTSHHVDIALLTKQMEYFAYTERLLRWLNYEGRRLAGLASTPPKPEPPQIVQPPLHIPS